MDLKLKVLEGKNAGQEIAIPGKKFLIGRAEDCSLRPGSELISRHHCVLLVEEGYVGVRDFGSKNGTYVNRERVIGERELKAGDRLTVGPLEFEVVVHHGLAAKKRPPVADIKEAAARTVQDSTHDPFDVSSWLDAEAGAETKAAPREIQEASLTDTDSIDVSNTQTVTPDSAEEKHAPKGPHAKKPPGKLPTITSSTKDSQSAAVDALNKFRKRR
jgi:pSer/pThr/pTyr-binding forkhead associated (FHA) protein